MTQVNFVITIVVKLINFAVVIGLGIFLYKRSLRGIMQDLMQRKIDRHQSLEAQTATLQADQQRVAHEKNMQELEGKDLLAIVHAWRSIVEQSLDVAAKERDALYDKAMQRAVQQEKNWYTAMVQKAAIEPTLHSTEQALEKKYNSSQSGVHYMAPIINELKKRA